MGKKICVVLFVFCKIFNVCSQNFLPFIVNDIKNAHIYYGKDSYVCCEMYKPSFAILEHEGFTGLTHKLETWLGIESVCELDSISMNSHPISMEKELRDCKISKKRVASMKKIEQIREKTQNSNICKQCEPTFKWYQIPLLLRKLFWRKCGKSFYFFSVPLQVENYQIMQMTEMSIFATCRDRVNIYYYIYNNQTNELKKTFVYSNY